jgi:hypothetical protein
MNERPDLARLAADALALDEERPASAAEQARAVARIAAAIRARKDSARTQRRVLGGVAAAATIAMALGLAERHSIVGRHAPVARASAVETPTRSAQAVVEAVVGQAYVFHGEESRSVVEGASVGAGDRLVVQRGGRVAFVLPTGTRVAIDEGSDIAVVTEGTTQRFRLAAGSIRADVHKLAQGEQFVVGTRDGEIEVRGTSFRLSDVPSDAACGNGSTTRLSVYEGVVAVRVGSAEARVAAGESWPANCVGVPSSAVPPFGEGPSSSGSAPTRSILAPVPSKETSRTLLAEQNDMYARAIAKRESGDFDGAVGAFDHLIAKYPACPLAENALAERMKILATANPPRAMQAAREYLAKYPQGYAREDANTVLGRGVPDR